MKRSYLHETYLRTNGSIAKFYHDETYLCWEITSVNMEEPITPSITLKRTIYETFTY